MNALLSEIYLILVRADCELHVRSTRYDQNRHHGGFPVRYYVRNYRNNSITKGGIRTFYLSNDCSTIGDISSLGLSCMRDTISKL